MLTILHKFRLFLLWFVHCVLFIHDAVDYYLTYRLYDKSVPKKDRIKSFKEYRKIVCDIHNRNI